jgi:drug/metabolite transporter (DMT)-like permease
MNVVNQKKAPEILVLLAFLAIYIVWGTTYMAVIYGLKGFPPFLLCGFRYSIAGLLLAAWCKVRKQPFPKLSVIRSGTISGLFMLIGGTGLVAWSEQYISSGQAAIIIASEPICFLLLDKKGWPNYFSNWYIVTGLIIGFGGTVLFFASGNSAEAGNTDHLTLGYAVAIVSVVLWVVGTLLAKHQSEQGVSNILMACIQLIVGGVGCLLLSWLTGELKGFSFANVPAVSWGGLFYLVFMGSLVAYVAYTWLITVRSPALVSTYTYVNPLIAVVMGWLFLHETMSGMQITAMFIILTGVLLTNFPSYRAYFTLPLRGAKSTDK